MSWLLPTICVIIPLLNQVASMKCFQCGSPLIQVSKVTAHPEGSLFPQTMSVFRCSNQECQDQKDKEEAKRRKLSEEKAVADQKRADERQKRHDEKVAEVLGSNTKA